MIYDDDSAVIDCGNPVDWTHPTMQVGVRPVAWWIAIPGLMGGAKLHDLMSPPDLRVGNHGTLTNGPAWRPASRPGGFGELSFDGASSQQVTIADSASLDFTNCGDWWTAAWVRLSGAGNFGLWGKPSGGLGDEFGMFQTVGSAIQLRVFNSTDGFKQASKSIAVAAGRWYWIYAEWNSATNIASVDVDNSNSPATVSVPNGLSHRAIPFVLSHNESGFSYFTGNMDDVVAARGRRLSATEQTQRYDLGRRGYQGGLRRVGRVAWSLPTATPVPPVTQTPPIVDFASDVTYQRDFQSNVSYLTDFGSNMTYFVDFQSNMK